MFCRTTQQSFLRLSTNSALFGQYDLPPLTNKAAWAAYTELLLDDHVSFLVEEPAGIDERWRAFADRPSASPKLWMDAYLAAFAFAAGLRLVTTDRAFRQFEGLDVLILGS